MLEWIKDAIHCWKGIRGGESVEERQAARLEARYDRILETAKVECECDPPGDYFMDGYNLYKRMTADKAGYLLFLRDFSIEPTNNLAERDGRKFKRKAAQVMCFRSIKGVTCFCDGLSVIQTLKSKGKTSTGQQPHYSITKGWQENKFPLLSP